MAVIETKYSIGDTVWYANITTEVKHHPCPDCLGSRKWIATSPAGGAFEVGCPRCAASYQANHALSLSYSVWTSTARRLTIGQVRPCSGDHGTHQYMCLETGIGSGSLYNEDRLFETEEAARACGDTMAAVNNANADGWVAKQYDATAKFCDYELKDAEIAAAKDASSRSLSAVGNLLEDLDEAESLEDVRQRIADWRERRAAA